MGVLRSRRLWHRLSPSHDTSSHACDSLWLRFLHCTFSPDFPFLSLMSSLFWVPSLTRVNAGTDAIDTTPLRFRRVGWVAKCDGIYASPCGRKRHNGGSVEWNAMTWAPHVPSLRSGYDPMHTAGSGCGNGTIQNMRRSPFKLYLLRIDIH